MDLTMYACDQVDICKRVLNIYRFLVMNVKLEKTTWLVINHLCILTLFLVYYMMCQKS